MNVHLERALVLAVIGTSVGAVAWAVNDYAVKSDRVELSARETCIKHGGSSVRSYGGYYDCVYSRHPIDPAKQ